MRALLLAAVLMVLSAGAWAQPSAFEDVPPWHWAFEAVRSAATAQITIGYPRNDRDLAANAVVQVYEAFAHPMHPQARAWAERFLVNLPADWPRPLQRSPLRAYRLEQMQVEISAGAGVASFVAIARLADGQVARDALRVRVRADDERRWRAEYPDFATGQPRVFR
ncbi:MAG: hypothetical protein QN163_02190 [Armatimonadota bacterium]|nr:hypothetical protein [Armatimonadota bacterium]MDR5696265.1 hypothetical protein [Armatimonadota bacterium]